MPALDELAARAIEHDASAAGLERLWRRAALTTLATGRPTDPDAAELRLVAAPQRVWADMLPLLDAIHDRVGRVYDTHRLAIAWQDRALLGQLDECWQQAPEAVDELTRLRARGEIDLALGGGGWSPEDLELLTMEDFIVAGAPAGKAWLALADDAPEASRQHTTELEALLDKETRQWWKQPETGIRLAAAHPGVVLRVEPRALRALAG